MDRVRKFCNSKAFVYILLAFMSLVFAALCKSYDYDLFARLIVGENFIENGTFLYKDFLSYTPTHIWYDHEWGSSLVFYCLYKYLGVAGFICFQATMLFLTCFWIIKTQALQKHAYPTSIAFMLLFLWLLSHLNPALVRCHMFSFMFYAMFLYFLEKTRLQNSNILWLVPPIVIIWNNLHGGVVSGLGMIFIYMVGSILTRKPFAKYFWVLAVSTLLLMINPYGIEYLTFLVSANTKTRSFITEWWGVFTGRHVIYYYSSFIFAAVALMVPVSEFIRKHKFDLIKLLALLTVVYLGCKHVKLLSISIITMASLYYNEIISLLEKCKIRFLNKFASGIIIASLFYIPFMQINVPRVDLNKLPVAEVEFLTVNKLKGNLLTSFGLGSYCTYKLYPQNLLYMDGRYEEVYYDREFEQLMDYERALPNWQNIYLDYPTDILMPERNVPVYNVLKEHPDWKLVYEGPMCGIFVKSNAAKKDYLLPTTDINYYYQTAFTNMGKFSEVNTRGK